MRRGLLGILSVSLLLAAPTAQGQADSNAERQAYARFREGIAKVKAHDFESARLAFAQAYVVLHKPDILWNLALAEERSGYLVEALGHFHTLDRDAPRDVDLASTKKHIAELQVQTGHIDVVCPAGATVHVDTGAEMRAPLDAPVDVMPGHHTVTVSVGGGEAKSMDVDAFAGRVVKADFGQAAPPVAVLPATPVAPSPDHTEPQTATPDANTDHPSGHGPSTAKIATVATVGGLALVAGGLGLGLGLASTNNANSASGLRTTGLSCAGSTDPRCAQLASDVSAQHSDHVASTAMWITGGVLAAGAVGLWFLWPNRTGGESGALVPQSASWVRVTPTFGTGSAGVLVGGGF